MLPEQISEVRSLRLPRVKISRVLRIQQVLFQNHARQTEIAVTKLFQGFKSPSFLGVLTLFDLLPQTENAGLV